MSLRIQNNLEAFNAHRQLTATASDQAKSMEKLSSGFRINRASDDAAGLEGTAGANDTAIGRVPSASDLDLSGLDIDDATMATLLSV